MRSLDGTLLLSRFQVKRLYAGKTIYIKRGGKPLTIRTKPKHSKERKIMAKIARLKRKLVAIRGGE